MQREDAWRPWETSRPAEGLSYQRKPTPSFPTAPRPSLPLPCLRRPSAWVSAGVWTEMIYCLAIFRSSSGEFLIWPVIGAAVGVYLFYHGFRLLQRKRLIMDTPSSKIRSASIGLVELNGLASGPYTMTAPITQVPCYYHRSMAWQWQQKGKNSEWVKVADESLHVPFYLDDNTGRVLVDPQGAEMEIHRDFHQEYGNSLFSTTSEVPLSVLGFLSRHGVSTDKKLKIEEYCIKPKNALFILGTLAENDGLEAGPTPLHSFSADQFQFNVQSPGILVGMFAGALKPRPGVMTFTREEVVQPQHSNSTGALGKDDQGKIAAAMIRAGITNPAAWAAAGLAQAGAPISVSTGTHGSAAAATMAPEQFDLHPKVVLKKGTHDPAFFISWRSQKDIVQSLGWKSFGMIWGGPALTLLCTYILAAHFGWL